MRSPVPGDLLIAELMPNPDAVDDNAGEWFEVRANTAFDLNGLELGREEGVADSVVEVEACIALDPGDHALIAREADPATNGGLPSPDATFGFSLVNSNGTLWVGAGGTTLDLVTWSSSGAGAARSLDPQVTDPAANDDEGGWCDAVDAYGDGDLGTPGSENPSCGGIATGTCTDGGSEREIVRPQAGDLVITELMPNPAAVNDADGEWFEVLATADIDLNGLEFGDDPGNPDAVLPAAGDCLAVAAGERVLLARQGDPAVNGGLPPVVGTFGFGLTNGGGTLFVGYGGEALDVITWSGSPTGASLSLDPGAENPADNDVETNFCASTAPYGNGDLGTPGAAGSACGGGGGMMDGMCLDGGVARAIVSPQPGDLIINEWMANPNVVSDTNGEWFEVYADASVDLNGLQLSRITGGMFQQEATLDSDECLSVSAGSYALFARSLDPATNGGLPAADFAFNFSLNNSSSGLAVGIDDAHLDEVTWSSSTAGAATSLDPGAQTTAGNDDPANLCAASTPYGPGDNDGTPGASNPPC